MKSRPFEPSRPLCLRLHEKVGIFERSAFLRKSRRRDFLRHTFATAAISKGADIRSVSDILGHENVAMTLNVYADADPHAKRRTIDMLDEEFSGAIVSRDGQGRE